MISAFFCKCEVRLFRRLIRKFPRLIRALDVGGAPFFWESKAALESEVY